MWYLIQLSKITQLQKNKKLQRCQLQCWGAYFEMASSTEMACRSIICTKILRTYSPIKLVICSKEGINYGQWIIKL